VPVLRFHIERLRVSGSGLVNAELEFGPALTLITGLSNTGKSHVLDCVDFALAGPLPREFPESQGYERVTVQIALSDDRRFTISRVLNSPDSDNAIVFEGEMAAWDGSAGRLVPVAISPSNPTETLSGWLLATGGFTPGTRLIKNNRGQSQILSFRNIAHLVMIREADMISVLSPVLPAQAVQQTAARSAFGVLVTGTSPTAEELATLYEANLTRDQALQRVDLLDGIIESLRSEITEEGADRQELELELERIDAELADVSGVVSESGARVRALLLQRNRALSDAEQARREETAALELETRFELLRSHYQADIRRLEFALEAGHFFDQISASFCPRCGRALEGDEECHTESAEFAQIENSARVEMKKLEPRLSDLELARADAVSDAGDAGGRRERLLGRAADLDREIREVANPTAETARARVGTITRRRRTIEEVLFRFRELDRYVAIREAARIESQRRVERARVAQDQPGLQRLSWRIRDLLTSWRFPFKTDVHFSVETDDIVIDGKDRKANGKGVRAVTHAAFTIGLMRHCLEDGTPHPGFVLIDTPLNNFKGQTDDVEDPELTRDLRAAFLHALATEVGRGQSIVLENVDPPAAIRGHAVIHEFTGPDGPNRKGFYPPR
jgi:hypothetical protein